MTAAVAKPSRGELYADRALPRYGSIFARVQECERKIKEKYDSIKRHLRVKQSRDLPCTDVHRSNVKSTVNTVSASVAPGGYRSRRAFACVRVSRGALATNATTVA